MTNDLVTKALKNAYYSQSPDKNKKLIFHSDLGSQYTSNDLKNYVKSLILHNHLVKRLSIWQCLYRIFPFLNKEGRNL